MSRHRSSSKRAPPEIGLHMECVEEELEPAQLAYYSKAEKEYNEIQTKLDNYIKKMKAEVIEKGESCLVLQLNATPSVSLGSSAQISTPTTTGKNTRQSSQNYQQMVSQGILTRSTASSAGNTYLVMDPRLGFMVGQVQPPNVPEQATPTTSKSVSSRTRQTAASGTVMITTRAKSGSKKQTTVGSEPEVLTPPATRTRDKSKGQTQVQQSTSPQTSPLVVQQQQQVYSSVSTSANTGNYRIKVNAKQMPPPAKPTENNALGGLSAGSKTPWKPSTDESNKSSADSREVTFNKVTGKTFPSLVVAARPHLSVKFIAQSTITQERTALDAKVKGVLMYTSTKFTEWLIQQGLIRSQQICETHVKNDLSPVKLKLGMYSDVSKFPYSGGYVWISDCCPSQFVSVFSGSIFEGAPHPPTTLLKLIYHWACQTNVQNVVQWVKVDNLYLKNFFTNMRAVCTQAVHENYVKMGGPRKKIEVGVISLGTTSQDGNRRQVKVEVLGVMDPENKLIRLRAVEPLSEERSFKRRFIKILEPLEDWVHKDSTILTDFTVAKVALNSMGFHNVFQVTNDSKYSNQKVMDYLRRIVPRMFQNTLSLLSRQIIQQFLDELVWREMWGPIASQAFVSIIKHIAEQTKLDVTENFLSRLNKVSSNPFKRWNYSVWKPITNSVSNTKIQGGSSQDCITLQVAPDSTETPTTPKGIRTRKRAAEQPLSESVPSPTSAKKMSKFIGKDKIKKEEKIKLIEKNIKKEPCDKLTDEFIKFVNEGKQVSLENYFYGTLNGESTYQYRGPFCVKCSVCNKRFNENIVLMKHMVLHCQSEPNLVIDLKKVHQCEYCFLGFNTALDLKTHEEEVHSISDNKVNSNLLCQICEIKFGHRHDLIFHMHKIHIEVELPYECGVCRFRTSVYKVFVDHFLQTHKGEEHIFCPYCLKIVTVSYKGVPIPMNVMFFMVHLEKHQRLSLIKDCNFCQLSFIHKGILDQHIEADHISWKSENVEPIQDLPGGILMPEPTGLIKPSPNKTNKGFKTKNLFTVSKFKTLSVNGLEEDNACVECEGSLTKSEHFTGSFNCLKCRYATCCEKAMMEHCVIFHEGTNLQFTMGKPIVLPYEMFCVCGYSSSSGNRIAKHIAICERKSAYASKESAAAALQCTSPTENVEENVKQGEGQNVLNMLGLVRKSPESTPAGNDSMKKEVDEEDEISRELDVKEEKQDVKVSDNKRKTDLPEVESREREGEDEEASKESVTLQSNEKPSDSNLESETERNETVAPAELSVEDMPMEVDKDSVQSLDAPMEVEEEKDDDNLKDLEEPKAIRGEEEMDVDKEESTEDKNDSKEEEKKAESEVSEKGMESSRQEGELENKENQAADCQMNVDETVVTNEQNSEDDGKSNSEEINEQEETNENRGGEGVPDEKAIKEDSVNDNSENNNIESQACTDTAQDTQNASETESHSEAKVSQEEKQSTEDDQTLEASESAP